jgi:hypothetical protein
VIEREKLAASGDLPQPPSPRHWRCVLLLGKWWLQYSGLFTALITLASFLCVQGPGGTSASCVETQPVGAASAAEASLEEVHYLTTHVAETGSRLEEALHDRRRLVEALNAARTTLNAVEAEVEAARVAADGANASRVGMCLGMVSFSG